ncbi:MAG: tyrosine-type recombinase/integrase [Bacteroidota bacterium]
MTNIKVRLDKSTKLKSGAHPICLQVTWGTSVRRKRIKGFSCKDSSWDYENHRYLYSQRKNALLDDYEKKARRIADDLDEWDYRRWVKEFDQLGDSTKKVEKKELIAYCYEIEQDYLKKSQISYAQNFKAIGSFLEKCFKNDMRIQDFGERELDTVLRVLDEREMKGYSYMKFLQIVLSLAIKNGYIKATDCPIKTKYSPTGYDINKRKGKSSAFIKKNRIKDLSESEKEKVVEFYYTAELPAAQKKHLALWILGYKLFGVNFKDLALMKWQDINNGYWKYSRSKTRFENKAGKPVGEEAMAILKEYDTGGKYILDILNGYDNDAKQIEKRLHNYKSNVRRSLKQISKRLGFSDDRYITWYTTRYTAPTLALSKGVDLNTVRTLMDHSSIKTTNNYLGLVRDRQKLQDAMDVL